jgi:hypothetical protein
MRFLVSELCESLCRALRVAIRTPRIDPWGRFSVPTTNSSVRDIVSGPGGIWFVEYNGNKIGRLGSVRKVFLPTVRR